MTVPDKLHELVDRFQYHIEDYKSGKYNETQVRRDFIDPLFGLLGWDVDNKANHAEAYREVIHEDSIKVGGATRAPDYCFRVGGTRKFFLEAKKTKVASLTDKSEFYLETGLLRCLVKGGNSKSYFLESSDLRIIFPYSSHHESLGTILSESILKDSFPLIWKYLLDHKEGLEKRDRGKMKGKGWYGFSRNQALNVIQFPKIFTPDIAPKPSFSLDSAGDKFFSGGVAGGYGIILKSKTLINYVLGLLNSKLLGWYIGKTSTQMRGGYYSFEARFIRGLPIYTIDTSNAEGQKRHSQIVSLVEQILELKQKLDSAKTAQDKTHLQRRIDATDKEIDQLVYVLYDLTEEEIKIVEESTQ
jgi:TaqI-like C-terminal specificity domain